MKLATKTKIFIPWHVCFSTVGLSSHSPKINSFNIIKRDFIHCNLFNYAQNTLLDIIKKKPQMIIVRSKRSYKKSYFSS